MHGQFLAGLAQLGHEVLYVETTSAWPFHPALYSTTSEPGYSLEYLDRTMTAIGLPRQWAYRPAYHDMQWRGPLADRAQEMIRSADAVLNITGSTTPEELGIECNLVYIGTDPVLPEFHVASGHEKWLKWLSAHKAHFSYGENIGQPMCPVPPLPFKVYPLRQPVVLDMWPQRSPARKVFTTVANWSMSEHDITFQGHRYSWSKRPQYLKLLDLPSRTKTPLEIAIGATGIEEADRQLLRSHGWLLAEAFPLSLDIRPYRQYILNSAAELSTAKEMVVKTRCGWFSERSACYLAAGRPVITQDTGFGRVMPTGEGLFAFDGAEQILAAMEQINSDYDRHSRAARAIAEEYFSAQRVLGRMLEQLGL